MIGCAVVVLTFKLRRNGINRRSTRWQANHTHTDVDQHSGNDSKQTECRLWFDSVYLIYILMWRWWHRLPLYFCYSLRVRLGCWELNWLGLTWLCIALTPAMKMLVHWCNHFRQTICTAIEIFGTTELNEWVWHLPTDISAMHEAKGRTYKTHIGFRLTHTHTRTHSGLN